MKNQFPKKQILKKQNSSKEKKNFDTFVQYSSLGFEMMAIIGIGTFGGYKIDQWMKNDFKAFTLGFMILSVVIAIFYGIRSLLKKK